MPAEAWEGLNTGVFSLSLCSWNTLPCERGWASQLEDKTSCGGELRSSAKANYRYMNYPWSRAAEPSLQLSIFEIVSKWLLFQATKFWCDLLYNKSYMIVVVFENKHLNHTIIYACTWFPLLDRFLWPGSISYNLLFFHKAIVICSTG